ncbi:hypothetical protein DL89DRAFT_268183, partial [Linderina pennispora]
MLPARKPDLEVCALFIARCPSFACGMAGGRADRQKRQSSVFVGQWKDERKRTITTYILGTTREALIPNHDLPPVITPRTRAIGVVVLRDTATDV